MDELDEGFQCIVPVVLAVLGHLFSIPKVAI